MPDLTAAPAASKTLLPSCALFGAALVLFGVFQSTPEEILRGGVFIYVRGAAGF